MIKNISSFLIACVALLSITSCINNEGDDTIYYNDTAITAFTLGTLTVSHTTKASDRVTDSTYTTSLTGSDYKFNIDQMAKTIYNTDSLPVGTSVSGILATITSKNSGVILLNLRNASGEDSLAYYSSTDSIDFTNPVRIRVYNMQGTVYREYTVSVNVHKQDSDAFRWNTANAETETMARRKFVTLGNDTYLFGETEDWQTIGFKNNGGTWQRLSTSLYGNAYSSMTAFKGYLYTLNGSGVYRSADGENWSEVAENVNIERIVGASTTHLYAMTENGIAYSTDGAVWTADSLDDSAAQLPSEDVNFVCRTSAADNNVNRLLLIGNCDGKTMIWSKVEENDNAASTQPWAYYTEDTYNRKTLPYLQNLQVVDYGDNLLATGGVFSTFYTSPDMGLTWTATSTFALPSEATGSTVPAALGRDNSNMLYFSTAYSGSIYSGRLAVLGWKNWQTVFTK